LAAAKMMQRLMAVHNVYGAQKINKLKLANEKSLITQRRDLFYQGACGFGLARCAALLMAFQRGFAFSVWRKNCL
jgi:hypothetical protein